ncbi:MAG: NAD(P)-binding protein [Planctomycetes bacterium]|nr:NAD(P)-binding protein [Planctomycetota bacterium]
MQDGQDGEPIFERLVLGAGRRGLLAALAAPRDGLLVVDAAFQPGGRIKTTRTNGYVCEHGAFAFAEGDLAPWRAKLPRLPTPIVALPGAGTGFVFDGHLRPLALDASPLTFRTGNEELVQAARHALQDCLRLGRTVVRLERADAGEAPFTIELGGEVPTTLRSRTVVLALPVAVTARLLGPFDPRLAEVGERVRQQPRALVWLGGDEATFPEAKGYGIVPGPDSSSPLAEVIFCSRVFPARALPGRFLVRCEVVLDAGSDDATALAIADRELRAWTGTRAVFALRKVERFAVDADDGALVECRVRLRDVARRVRGLVLA